MITVEYQFEIPVIDSKSDRWDFCYSIDSGHFFYYSIPTHKIFAKRTFGDLYSETINFKLEELGFGNFSSVTCLQNNLVVFQESSTVDGTEILELVILNGTRMGTDRIKYYEKMENTRSKDLQIFENYYKDINYIILIHYGRQNLAGDPADTIRARKVYLDSYTTLVRSMVENDAKANVQTDYRIKNSQVECSTGYDFT